MNLFREYLRFFNSGMAWMVYAARNQALSVPIDSSVGCPQPAEDGSRDGHPLRRLCLIGIVFLLTAATQPPNHATMLPRKLAVEWRLGDEWRVWLEMVNTNSRDFPREGWHPSYSEIYSKYKPVVHKLPDGRWRIQFTSEIAEQIDLP